ncbi:MAG TPA: hypothetical protein VHD32_07290 [Candidatus Didemnitutus sp.]|nr:hypothetical protein [Candidatus Didemnitutus sp.]
MSGPGRKQPELSAQDDDATGLPGLSHWSSVYVLVTVLFVTWVGLLIWLTFAFA